MTRGDMMMDQPFVLGERLANPKEKSVRGFKAAYCLSVLQKVRGSLLEVGCGGGQYLRMLRQHRPDLAMHGIDLDPAAVGIAAQDRQCAVVCASAGQLPYQPEQFSAVVGLDILEHVDDPLLAVREVHRVMGKGGVGCFYVPCEGNRGGIYSILGHYDRKKRHTGQIQRFTTDQVIGLFQTAGFQVREVRHTDHFIGQVIDYLFFRQLERSRDPEALWAAQELGVKNGQLHSFLLCLARVITSAVTWCEWKLCSGRRGSMGVILSVEKGEPA